METKKSKVFTRKLLSLVLALVMAVSSFFGVAMSAQAYQKSARFPYNDNQLAHNLINWVDATDDQTLEALLDYLDDFLANMDWDNLNEKTSKINLDLSSVSSFINLGLYISQFPNVKVSGTTVGIANLVGLQFTIEGSVDSIDNIIDLLFSVKTALNKIIDKAGKLVSIASINVDTISSLNFDVFGNYFHNEGGSGAGYKDPTTLSYRDHNSAKYILKGLLKWLLNDNYYNNGNSNVIHDLLYGSLSLITRNGSDMVDLYKMLEGTLGMEDWEKNGETRLYQTGNGIVYNLLKTLIVKNVPIYNGGAGMLKTDSSWVYDNELYNIANYYLQKLSFEITYPERVDFTGSGMKDAEGNDIEGYRNDSSKRRYAIAKAAGKFDESTGKIDAAFATANKWDPNLIYSTEEGYEGNVLVAKYGSTTFSINANDTLHSAFMRAVPIVWKTALKPTVQLVHVNYNGHDEHGTNFDNAFYYWVSDNIGWNRTDWTQNYTAANMAAFTAAKYQDYGFDSAADFEEYIGYTLTYNKDRLAKNKYYNWRDINASILFNEIRYSPLADQYFHIQTGPLNLYFEQIGCPNVINYFDNTFNASGTLIGQIDDVLVTAMADLFPASQNNTVGKTVENDGAYSVTPMTLTGLTTDSTGTVAGTISALIGDAAKVLQYAADATDANILNSFYAFNGANTQVTEANLEEAVIPFAISALKHWSLTEPIHNSDWDKVCDIESGAVVALSEYLGYIYPDRDYSQYYDLEERNAVVGGETVATYKYIVAKSNQTLLNDVIVPMAGDALLFVVTAAGVPVYKQTPGATTVVTEGYNNNTGNAEILDPYSYTFFGKGSGIDNVLWQTINGVACYFAVDKGIAGLVNLEGVVTKTNTIWQNLDGVLNRLLPALSPLFKQATSAGDGAVSNSVGTVSTKKLIWDQLVCGLADVGGQTLFTKIFTYVGDLFTCDPLTNTKMINFVVFDVVKPLINKVLGARTGTANIITQTSATSNPIDTFLKRDNLINTSVTNLIGNLYNVLSSNNVYTANTYKAVTFILTALHLIPKISDNRIGGVSATLSEHAVTSTAVDLKLSVRNESWGFASFYSNASGNTAQRGRYDATIVSYQVLNPDGSVNNNFTFSQSGSYTPTGSLPAEGFTRVKLTGTAAMNTLYTIVVNYTMAVKDVNGGSITRNYSAKAVDFLYVGNTINDSWSSAFSGNSVSSTASDALVTKNDVGDYTYVSANYIGLGTNAGGASYGYKITNKSTTESTVHNSYATVAANTPNYYDFEGNASTSADSGAAYIAVNKSGKILKADGTTVDVYEYVNSQPDEFLGYISPDNGATITAVTIDVANIATYIPGTPLAGVYLDTNEQTIKAGENSDDGVVAKDSTIRIISEDSQGGLSTAAYAPMVVTNSKGYSFGTIISVGDLDGAYSNYKSHAKGLAVNYITSSNATAYNSIKTQLTTALGSTIADGINASNINRNIDVVDADEALIETAKDNPTYETNAVINNVIVARRGCTNINYTSPALYEKAVDIAKEAESLLIADAVMVDGVDDSGQPIKEAQRDADGNIVYKYYSYAPAIQLQEAQRSYTALYAPSAVIKAYNDTTSGKLITEEVTHATSKCDDFDDVIAASANDYTDFTATKDSSVEPYEFPYSTKTGHEYDLMDTYNVTVAPGTELKFGAIGEGNKLVNEGATVYSAESWKVYVDALGECIATINSGATISDCYDARSHLVMAENNLEEGETEGITISGRVYISKDNTGTDGTFGARGIKFKVDGEYVLDAEGQPAETSDEAGHYGEFSITVPERTTEITLTGNTTVDRTVTLSGAQNVDNASVVIVTVDNNRDGYVNNADFGRFKKQINGSDIDYDLNDDNYINNADFGAFKKLLNKPVSYSAQALD